MWLEAVSNDMADVERRVEVTLAQRLMLSHPVLDPTIRNQLNVLESMYLMAMSVVDESVNAKKKSYETEKVGEEAMLQAIYIRRLIYKLKCLSRKD